MKVAGEHAFRAPRAHVWAALESREALERSLPGVRRLVATGPDEYEIAIDVGVGSVKGVYEGSFALADKVPGESCTVRASAGGRPGTVTATARMRLTDGDGGGARLAYEADAEVTGSLAGVGQRLMGAAARRTTEQFLSALDDWIASPEPERPRERAPRPARAGADPVVIAVSALAGFALALIGVAVGRWTARR